MRLSEFTTVELQRVARSVLRRYLDVRAGFLPPAALRQVLSPAAAADLQRLEDLPSLRAVRQSDVGPAVALRLAPKRAYAIAALAGAGGPPVVLSVELAVQGQRLAASRVGESAIRTVSQDQPLGQAPRAFNQPWTSRNQPWVGVDQPRVGPGQPVPQPPAHLRILLGDLPSDPQALGHWVRAAAVIDTYRERYGIDEAGAPFGPEPTDREQQRERDRALDYGLQLARHIEVIEPRQIRGVGREQAPSLDLGF